MKNQTVSIVITTKNEEINIGNCLQSIADQTYNSIEIIVVDNYSTDRTKEISRRYTHHIYDKGPERSAQRNYGMIEIATGNYVMFVDADMILAPTLIEQCVKFISQSNHLALHIPEIILGTSYFSRVRRFERNFYDGTVVDGSRFFLKEAFIRAGGFDESMSGPEDWDIDKKIKKRGTIGLLDRNVRSASLQPKWRMHSFIENRGVNPSNTENVLYHNEAEFDVKKYLAKKGYYSKSFDIYIKKWGKNDLSVKKQIGFAYRFFWVFVENENWKKLLANAHLTVGMYFLRILVGATFIVRRIN
jgi:glycosyltransferase involved in cell wall biosynthesis